jgi:very-short-patch-repair endonuclease
MTDAEQRLWHFLRAGRFGGLKFKRQAPIGPYAVDFVCFEHSMVIEVDGGQHAENENDVRRNRRLRDEGYHVARFWNNDVLKQTRAVLARLAEMTGRDSTPLPARSARHPLPQGEKGNAPRG